MPPRREVSRIAEVAILFPYMYPVSLTEPGHHRSCSATATRWATSCDSQCVPPRPAARPSRRATANRHLTRPATPPRPRPRPPSASWCPTCSSERNRSAASHPRPTHRLRLAQLRVHAAALTHHQPLARCSPQIRSAHRLAPHPRAFAHDAEAMEREAEDVFAEDAGHAFVVDGVTVLASRLPEVRSGGVMVAAAALGGGRGGTARWARSQAGSTVDSRMTPRAAHASAPRRPSPLSRWPRPHPRKRRRACASGACAGDGTSRAWWRRRCGCTCLRVPTTG